jgi:hypothetical protein
MGLQQQVCAVHGLTPNEVTWSGLPPEFPCLVGVKILAGPGQRPEAHVCCFLPQGARYLLAALDDKSTTLQGPHRQPASTPTPTVSPSLAETLRSVSANLLTVAHFLVETGICKQEQYLEKYTAFLAQVDQWHAETVEDRLNAVAKTILEQTQPRKE